jgi:hypothetical protein
METELINAIQENFLEVDDFVAKQVFYTYEHIFKKYKIKKNISVIKNYAKSFSNASRISYEINPREINIFISKFIKNQLSKIKY